MYWLPGAANQRQGAFVFPFPFIFIISNGIIFPILSRLGKKGDVTVKLLLIVAGILFLLLLTFVVWCCLVMASVEDRRMEKWMTEHRQQEDHSEL